MPSYIAFEGGEGSGKSTQVRLLAGRIDALVTREPGGTDLGAQLRQTLLGVGEAPIGHRAEALLMAADRAQHVTELIIPTLESGRHVISDRSAYSSLAYQGGARGLGIDEVRNLNNWAIDGFWPQIVVFLDVDVREASERIVTVLDRLESEGDDFHAKVSATYRSLAKAEPDKWIVIDGVGTIEDIEAQIWAEIEPRLES